MRRFCWAGLAFILMGACRPGIPKDIIQPQAIRSVLYDIHVVDGFITTIPVPDSARIVSAAYYKAVYKKHGVDSALYTRSMNYYYDHPEDLTEIYKDVTEKLKKSKDSVDKIQEKLLKKLEAAKKKTQDSLDKADPKLKLQKDAAAKKRQDSLHRGNLILQGKALPENTDSLKKVKKTVKKKRVSVKKVK